MSLVTEQGRKARAEAQAHAEALREPMLQFVTEAEPVSVSKLLARFSTEKENVVREAMWLLLDAGVASIDQQRRIVLAGGAP